MAKRIYVGSLPYAADAEQLRTLFARFGQVGEVVVVTDRDTGQAKGFGFVEMPNNNEAEQAIKQLNGSEMGGRSIVVNEARERSNSGGGRSGGGGGRRW